MTCIGGPNRDIDPCTITYHREQTPVDNQWYKQDLTPPVSRTY